MAPVPCLCTVDAIDTQAPDPDSSGTGPPHRVAGVRSTPRPSPGTGRGSGAPHHEAMTRSPIHLDADIRALGGIASAAELLDLGYTRDALRLWGDGRRSRHLRRGWYALRDLPEEVTAAWDAGGVVACVSVLDLATSREASRAPEELHICVPRTASRIPRTVLLRGRDVRIVAHWSTADHGSGTRRGVDAATAVRQARRCARRPAADASAERCGARVGAEHCGRRPSSVDD